MMKCRIVELRNKDVVSIQSGARLGRVGDVEVDTCTARLTALVIYGRPKLCGLLGHEDDCIVCWEDIAVIGDDTILVKCDAPPRPQREAGKRRSLLDMLLGDLD